MTLSAFGIDSFDVILPLVLLLSVTDSSLLMLVGALPFVASTLSLSLFLNKIESLLDDGGISVSERERG